MRGTPRSILVVLTALPCHPEQREGPLSKCGRFDSAIIPKIITTFAPPNNNLMKLNIYYVYILSNESNKVLYTGVTNNLVRRVYEHKSNIQKGYTYKYNVKKLVYFEVFKYIDAAISREKQIKGYCRTKKNNLIEAFNPGWEELCVENKIVRTIDLSPT